MATFNSFPALAIRPPSISDGSGNAMRMMNMMAQQQAAQRQAAQAQQSMDIARAGEERAAAKSKQEFRDTEYKYYRDMVPAVAKGGPQAYAKWLGAVSSSSPEVANIIGTAMPVDKFDPDNFMLMVMNIDQAINKKYATPIASFFTGQNGELYGAQTGGTQPSYMTRAAEMDNPLLPSNAPPVGTATVEPGVSTAAPVVSETQGALMDPQGAAQLPPLVKGEGPRLWGEALRSGVITATNAQRLMNALPPDKHAAFIDAFKKQGVQVVPDATLQQQSFETPEVSNDAMFNQARWDYENPQPFESAVYRGEPAPMANAIAAGAAPELTQAQFAGVVGRPATVIKIPPSANVPLPRVTGESEAETRGKEGVRVVTQPKIVAGEERMKRLEKLRGDLPTARAETETVISDLEQKIAAIDDYLRNPYRNSIIGPVEGNLPRLLQFGDRADTQAQWDFITNNSVLQKLIDDRKSTDTGASPQGIVSDRDLAVAASAANKLRQTGEPATQEKELRRIRDIWYETMQRARRTYGDTYREVMEPQFAVRDPRVPPSYSPTPAPTSDDIATLRRNINKPNFVEGFKKHFGEKAFKSAVGGR